MMKREWFVKVEQRPLSAYNEQCLHPEEEQREANERRAGGKRQEREPTASGIAQEM